MLKTEPPIMKNIFPHIKSFDNLYLQSSKNCLSPIQTNEMIGRLLCSNQPFMVARFGSIELNVVRIYRKMKTFSAAEKLVDFFYSGDWSYWWIKPLLNALENNAGFFPINHANVMDFSEIMIDAMKNVDLLASWVSGERYFSQELCNASICSLPDIEPYYHQNPWSQFLAGRKILVIHPFANSIQNQYDNSRRLIFTDPLLLPEFNLVTMPAVQSIAGNRPSEYADWFIALDAMYEQAMKANAEVIILGCGAYGFPLAAKLKSVGKQVIHMGGCTQILFGIKGKRWDEEPRVSSLYNQHWIRPSSSELPPGANKVENACYW